MTLIYIKYLILAIVLFVLLSLYLTSVENKFYRWVEDYWFKKRSFASKLSSFLFIIGIGFLIFSILDLRGPEENIEAKVSKERTLILIDSSASMLTEDVRPNRFQKAIVLAKHYVKKAVGQHISVIVFSDKHKKIVPFTNDIDLVNARLEALEGADLSRGGTGLKIALQEAIQYFQVDSKETKGNVLIFTDAENTEEYGINKIPEDVNIGVVGVGTVRGGPIPIRDKRGVSRGNKKFKGKEVISKLNETLLVELGTKIKNYKYWIASSYSLPTTEIIDFFNQKMDEQEELGSVKIRPVLVNYLAVPGVCFLILAFLFRNFKSFTMALLLFCTTGVIANEKTKVKEVPKTEDALYLEGKLKQGSISEVEKKKLANELIKTGHGKEAMGLYEEIIDGEISKENKEDYFNLGAAQLIAKDSEKGLKTYKKLYDYLKEKGDKELLNKTKLNMLKALKMQQQKKEQEKKDKKKKEQEKKDKKNQKKSGKNKKENKDNKDSKKDKKNGKGQGSKDQKDQKDNKDNRDKKDQKDQKDQNEDKNKDKKDDKQKKQDQKQNQNKDSGKRKKRKKIPALLKQLMQDDNKLQRKMIDTSSSERKTRDRKDW